LIRPSGSVCVKETPVSYVNRALFATAVSEIHMLVPNLG
jgi:hypothetical protein